MDNTCICIPAQFCKTESEEQTSPYTPMPGQTTVEDLEDVMPEGTVEPSGDASPAATLR